MGKTHCSGIQSLQLYSNEIQSGMHQKNFKSKVECNLHDQRKQTNDETPILKKIVMDKYTVITLAAIVTSFNIYAQEKKETEGDPEEKKEIMLLDHPKEVFDDRRFDWGITLGANIGDVEIGQLGRARNEEINIQNAGGVFAGVFAQPQADMFYIKPALHYVNMHGTYQAEREKTDFSLVKLELPFMVGVKIFKHLSVEAGPVVSQVLSVTTQYPPHGKLDFGKQGLGYQGALGFDNENFYILGGYRGISYRAPGLKNSLREMMEFTFYAGYKFRGWHTGYALKKHRSVYLPGGPGKMRIRYFKKK
jgi:hypothetical protein